MSTLQSSLLHDSIPVPGPNGAGSVLTDAQRTLRSRASDTEHANQSAILIDLDLSRAAICTFNPQETAAITINPQQYGRVSISRIEELYGAATSIDLDL